MKTSILQKFTIDIGVKIKYAWFKPGIFGSTIFVGDVYLVIYMLSRTFLNIAVKNDTRVAMPKINQEKLNKILVSLPPFEEQKRIVSKVDKLMKLCDELETKLTQTQTESEKIINAAVKQLLTV
ncbi:restriction endonuclease subunit S [Anabaena sp. UHCC 0253]|uniref:restriction endonuclease subunit S n=1 Tax=Anabaena sp. UHCC 0253 TaxID=2590019 RepID=UPI001C2B9A50|nr:restriction endonuclease subunit S [Anabaena sp. UHCC 0253]